MISITFIQSLAEWIWTERLFLVSFATLLAIISLNVMAYRYKRRKEEPARFELDKAYLDPRGYALSLRLQNVGEGECEEFKIVNVGYNVGGLDVGLNPLPYPYIDNHIEPGGHVETTIKPSPGFEEFDDKKRIFAIDCEVDGARDRVYIMPSELEEKHWMHTDAS